MPRHGFTLVPERRQLYPQLSVADNIVLGSYSRARSLRRARGLTGLPAGARAVPRALRSDGAEGGHAVRRRAADGRDRPGSRRRPADPRRRRAMPRTRRDGEPARLRGVAADPRGGAHAADRRGVSGAGAPARHPAESRSATEWWCAREARKPDHLRDRHRLDLRRVRAPASHCWYRVCNILNLAVGDFAMLGALGVDDLVRVHHWKLAPAIAANARNLVARRLPV